MDTVGFRIAKRREELGISQKALAELLGITPTRLNYWEKGKREPDVFYIKRISEVLKTSGNYLLGIGAPGDCDSYTDDERQIIAGYRSLDPKGRFLIKTLLELEMERTEAIRARIWAEVEARGYKIEAAHAKDS